MDLLKALKRTTIISAMSVLALGATQARAADTSTVDTVGHIGASVTGLLSVTERTAVNFGNFATTGGVANGDGTITLTNEGARSSTGLITLLTGQGQAAGSKGVTDAGGLGTGGETPGFYTINDGGEGAETLVYVSFANDSGAIVDNGNAVTAGGACPVNHPNNYTEISLNGAGAVKFKVDYFTFEADKGTQAGPSASGYTQLGTISCDAYGTGVTIASGANTIIRVGARLATEAGMTYTPGKYTGTFNVMVSY